jgi:hypothetical protein
LAAAGAEEVSSERDDKVRRAADLAAKWCERGISASEREELSQLVLRQRITLREFATALGTVADEHDQSAEQEHRTHDWVCEVVGETPGEGGVVRLDVLLACQRCGTRAEFRWGAVPSCRPGEKWQWTGTAGWGRTDDD